MMQPQAGECLDRREHKEPGDGPGTAALPDEHGPAHKAVPTRRLRKLEPENTAPKRFRQCLSHVFELILTVMGKQTILKDLN